MTNLHHFVFTFLIGGVPHRFVISAENDAHAEAAFLEMRATLHYDGREADPLGTINGQPVMTH